MHSSYALMWYLRVSDLKWEWWLDLPELTSIQLGEDAFCFHNCFFSGHLVMQSKWSGLRLRIDLPKLTTLTTIGEESSSFGQVYYIILESDSFSPLLTTRHAFSRWIQSASCFLLWMWVFSDREFSFILSVTPRYWCSCSLCSLPCLFHQGVVIAVFLWGCILISFVRNSVFHPLPAIVFAETNKGILCY